LGRIQSGGVDVPLQGGVNFGDGFTVETDAANKRLNLGFDSSGAPIGPGSEVGQAWTWDGSTWAKRRSRIRPSIDTTGTVDAAAAIQAALDSRAGACVELPDGIIRLNSPVSVPRGCALVGRPSGVSFGHKQFSDIDNVGTRIDVRHTGKAFLLRDQSTVESLCLYYPDQVTTGSSPTDYDYAFYGVTGGGENAYGFSLLNITLMNAYRGIFVSANGGTIDRVQGAPMLRGIDLGRCADVVRVSNVQFNSGGSAGMADSALVAWMRANLTAFGIDGADIACFTDCFAYGANIGIDFTDTDLDDAGSTVTWSGGGIDTATNAIRIPANASLWKLLMSNAYLIGISSDVIAFSDDIAGAFKPFISASNISTFGASTGCFAKWASTSYGRLVLHGAEISGYTGYGIQSASANAIGRLHGVGMGTTSRVDPAASGDFQDIGGWLSA
jgi:hypothetical protein